MTILIFKSAVFVRPISAFDTDSTMILLSLGKEWLSSSSLPLFFLPFLFLKASNQKKALCFLGIFSLLGDAGSGNKGRKIPTFPSHLPFSLCFYGVVMRVGGRNCSTGYSPLASRRDGCDVVITVVEELVWLIRDTKLKHLFCFLLGLFLCWIQLSCKFLDLN